MGLYDGQTLWYDVVSMALDDKVIAKPYLLTESSEGFSLRLTAAIASKGIELVEAHLELELLRKLREFLVKERLAGFK